MSLAPTPDHTFEFAAAGGATLAGYRWDAQGQVRGALFFAHGMGEHAQRYGRFARALGAAGVTVFGYDQRGHGEAARQAGLLGHFADEDGFQRIVDDIEAMRQHVRDELPEVPLGFMGHSMGSLAGQEFLIQHGGKLDYAILSGTTGGQGLLLHGGKLVARIERRRLGPRVESPIINALTFGDYNRAFKPARTDSDWLSRDEAEVDKYVADPLCGATLTTQSWCDFFDGLMGIEKLERQKLVPKGLPMLIFAGDRDPVGRAGKGPKWLAERYARCGLNRVQLKLYAEGRHEMLNEINRDQVFQDLVTFVGQVGLK